MRAEVGRYHLRLVHVYGDRSMNTLRLLHRAVSYRQTAVSYSRRPCLTHFLIEQSLLLALCLNLPPFFTGEKGDVAQTNRPRRGFVKEHGSCDPHFPHERYLGDLYLDGGLLNLLRNPFS